MPPEAVVVEPGPEKTDTERACGKEGGEDAPPHGWARGVVVGEGAKTDAGVAHAGGRFREGKEEELIEQSEEEEGCRSCEDGGLR